MAGRDMLPLEGAKDTFRVKLAHALAEAFVLGVDECHEEGVPLSQKQRIKMTEMMVMVYADEIQDAATSLTAEAMIWGMVAPPNEAAAQRRRDEHAARRRAE